jgi:integrase
MNREALVPIDEELKAGIIDQQRRVRHRWPQGTPVLFPRVRANPDGSKRASHSGYQHALGEWLRRCDIRDEHGQPVHLTPHQYRHTLVICTAFSARGTTESGPCRIVPQKYLSLREARTTRPVPGSFSLRCYF